MGLFSFFKSKSSKTQPEDLFQITIDNYGVKVEHPKRNTEHINWEDIEEIKLINTDTGPFAPDIWLALLGKESGCLIPHGANGYEKVYDKVSKYPNFNFENVINSMTCSTNEEFLLWSR